MSPILTNSSQLHSSFRRKTKTSFAQIDWILHISTISACIVISISVFRQVASNSAGRVCHICCKIQRFCSSYSLLPLLYSQFFNQSSTGQCFHEYPSCTETSFWPNLSDTCLPQYTNYSTQSFCKSTKQLQKSHNRCSKSSILSQKASTKNIQRNNTASCKFETYGSN